MIGFYLVRGHDMEKLINLSNLEKLAYMEFMELHYEEEKAKIRAMGGKV